MTKPTLTAVLTCHNRRAKTLACLDALFACGSPADLRVVLYDDGSMDGTAEAVRRRYPAIVILEGDGQAFWAGGMRAAFAAAMRDDADFYLWLNDDVLLKPDALSRMLEVQRALDETGHPLCIVGGAVADAQTGCTTYAGIVRPHAQRPLRFSRQKPHPTRVVGCDTLVGNVVLIPRVTAAAFGGIGPAFRHTLGDLDYGLRVTAGGGCCVLAPGHVGWCEPNRRPERWFNPELPLAARWRLLSHPLGFPLRPWLHFARRHGGPLWMVFAVLPFWRLVVPIRLARLVDHSRRQRFAKFRHA